MTHINISRKLSKSKSTYHWCYRGADGVMLSFNSLNICCCLKKTINADKKERNITLFTLEILFYSFTPCRSYELRQWCKKY